MKKKYFLIAGGVMDALISLLHLTLAFKPDLYGIIVAGQESGISELASQGLGITTLVSVILALIFTIWALYAFSGAGLIRQLPLLRTALITIGVIYVLRALFLPSEINMVLTQDYPFCFVVYSLISLLAGFLHLTGVLGKRKS